MKRFLILLSLLFCNMVYADTINLHWLNDDGTVYENSTCVIDSDLILPSTPPTRYGYTFTGWEMVNYQPIEYLESTGTQYIDTQDTYPNRRWEIVAQRTNNSYTAECLIFGFGSARGQYVSALPAGWNMSGVNKVYGDIYAKTNIIFDYLNNTVSLYLNGMKVDETIPTETGRHILFFGTIKNADLKPGYFFVGRLYSVKAYDNNNVLIYDFIPVLDYNGIPCMYDKVTQQFFYNQGTGQFIAGPSL